MWLVCNSDTSDRGGASRTKVQITPKITKGKGLQVQAIHHGREGYRNERNPNKNQGGQRSNQAGEVEATGAKEAAVDY